MKLAKLFNAVGKGMTIVPLGYNFNKRGMAKLKLALAEVRSFTVGGDRREAGGTARSSASCVTRADEHELCRVDWSALPVPQDDGATRDL